MPTTSQRAILGLATALLLLMLLGAAPASAYGPCGTDSTGPTACPIATSPMTVTGTLAATHENDYYVFYARPHTQLSLTITDTESPTCGVPGYPTPYCSSNLVLLYDGQGNYIDQSSSASPQNGITNMALFSRTLTGGIYYAVVTGNVNSGGPIPYSLSVEATPNVQYPPPCVVPKLRHNTSLARAKRLLARHDCAVGKISHRFDRRVRRGNVIGLRPRARTYAPFGTPVAIIVSGRRRRHRR